ncbi:MAG TPA: CPBP family intramembrane glutamic endopeptidase [Candidatus Acidoferrales bacterium]|nr:CPBP family intramembrane glutamic endopeptidase [Candidatus Acidoferrales bacterium]
MPGRRLIYLSSAASQWVLAAIVYWRARVRGYSLRSLGVVASPAALLAFVGVGIAIYLIAIQFFVIRRALKAAPQLVQKSRTMQIMQRLMPVNQSEIPAFILLAVTAGACEEFLYRGFVYSHLASFAGVWLALLASSALFGVAHLYQGRQGVIGTFVIGSILGGGRLWTGSILPGAIAHFLFDLSAGLIVASWIRRAASALPAQDSA